jgi:hypothetical protein
LNYKSYLIEEIFYCVKHIGFTYQDVLNMSVYERRQYLNLLLNENKAKEEAIEEEKEKYTNNNAKGSRTTKVSGDQLKAKLKSGEIPN